MEFRCPGERRRLLRRWKDNLTTGDTDVLEKVTRFIEGLDQAICESRPVLEPANVHQPMHAGFADDRERAAVAAGSRPAAVLTPLLVRIATG